MPIKFLKGYFSYDLIIELSEHLFSIRSFSGDKKYEDIPLIAIETVDGEEIVREIGSDAKNAAGPNIQVTNPFSHTRSFVSNFAHAEKFLRHAIRKFHQPGINLKPAPRVVMHQLEKTEGGLTDIEERVLNELALAAGARDVLVYSGDRINTELDSYEKIKARINAG